MRNALLLSSVLVVIFLIGFYLIPPLFPMEKDVLKVGHLSSKHDIKNQSMTRTDWGDHHNVCVDTYHKTLMWCMV